jgi:hypothetical protein
VVELGLLRQSSDEKWPDWQRTIGWLQQPAAGKWAAYNRATVIWSVSELPQPLQLCNTPAVGCRRPMNARSEKQSAAACQNAKQRLALFRYLLCPAI